MLCCGEGFPVSGKREVMGLILKDRMRFFPFVLFAFPPLSLLSSSDEMRREVTEYKLTLSRRKFS